jgi:hypothetical protein
MVDKKIASALCAAFCAIAIGASPLDAFQQSCCPGINETGQVLLNMVNTESGASESSKSEETVWTYSLALADPCTLNLTEQKKTLKNRNSEGPVTSTRETTHYLIPAADLAFGRFSTHNTLKKGFMRVILFTQRATIRRWHGDSANPPEDAAVIFDAGINFGKPNVDIFEVPVIFQDVLMHLTGLCRAAIKPVPHPFCCQ